MQDEGKERSGRPMKRWQATVRVLDQPPGKVIRSRRKWKYIKIDFVCGSYEEASAKARTLAITARGKLMSFVEKSDAVRK